MKKRLINKKSFKKAAGRCRVCGEDIYELLDTHRLVSGAEGGKYYRENCVVLCGNCHRKVHAGLIEIDRYYLCSNGKYKLRVIIDGEEKFI